MARPAMPMKSMKRRALDDDVTQFGLRLAGDGLSRKSFPSFFDAAQSHHKAACSAHMFLVCSH
jgi:hypothetical protein